MRAWLTLWVVVWVLVSAWAYVALMGSIFLNGLLADDTLIRAALMLAAGHEANRNAELLEKPRRSTNTTAKTT